MKLASKEPFLGVPTPDPVRRIDVHHFSRINVGRRSMVGCLVDKCELLTWVNILVADPEFDDPNQEAQNGIADFAITVTLNLTILVEKFTMKLTMGLLILP